MVFISPLGVELEIWASKKSAALSADCQKKKPPGCAVKCLAPAAGEAFRAFGGASSFPRAPACLRAKAGEHGLQKKRRCRKPDFCK